MSCNYVRRSIAVAANSIENQYLGTNKGSSTTNNVISCIKSRYYGWSYQYDALLQYTFKKTKNKALRFAKVGKAQPPQLRKLR